MAEQTPFNAADESLLEAALNQSFSASPKDIPRPAAPSAPADVNPSSEPISPPQPLVSSQEIDAWKSEYDTQVDAWRAESADAREKAEKERKRWEEIRAREPPPAPLSNSGESSWEKVGNKDGQSVTAVSGQPSIADSRDLVTGEKQGGPSHSQHGCDDGGKWEDVRSSMSSSFPSMTFPEHEGDDLLATRNPPSEVPMSATVAIFDSSLSTRTRCKALFASLAINLLLPFVNGVMLGFGEIFAKNIVLEWWRPGSSATQIGIRQRRRS